MTVYTSEQAPALELHFTENEKEWLFHILADEPLREARLLLLDDNDHLLKSTQLKRSKRLSESSDRELRGSFKKHPKAKRVIVVAVDGARNETKRSFSIQGTSP